MSTSTKCFSLIAVVLLMAGPAYPQERQILQLNSDVLNLKHQITQLQSTVDEKTRVLQSLVEKIFDQVNGLASNMQRVNQAVDNVNARGDKSDAELRALITAMSTRVNELSENVTSIHSQLSGVSQQITSMRATSEALPSPEETWRAAYSDYLAGSYDLAIEEFREYQTKYPGDARAPEAQRLVAKSMFNQKKFDQALIEYDLFLQKYPENEQTKTALYERAQTLDQLKDPKAPAAYQEIIRRFPNTVEATNARQRLATGARGQRP